MTEVLASFLGVASTPKKQVVLGKVYQRLPRVVAQIGICAAVSQVSLILVSFETNI